MTLMCLAGAYAGHVREYGPVAGLAALKTGAAARIGDVGPVRTMPAQAARVTAPVVPAPVTTTKRKTR